MDYGDAFAVLVEGDEDLPEEPSFVSEHELVELFDEFLFVLFAKCIADILPFGLVAPEVECVPEEVKLACNHLGDSFLL